MVGDSSHSPLRPSEHRCGLKHTGGDRDRDGGEERPAAKRAKPAGEDLGVDHSKYRTKDWSDGKETRAAGLKSDYDKSKGSTSGNRHWLAPNLRVRIVDTKYKKGLYYNTKVISMRSTMCVVALLAVHVGLYEDSQLYFLNPLPTNDAYLCHESLLVYHNHIGIYKY